MVAVLDASALVLSPDTAPMHIANALGRLHRLGETELVAPVDPRECPLRNASKSCERFIAS